MNLRNMNFIFSSKKCEAKNARILYYNIKNA